MTQEEIEVCIDWAVTAWVERGAAPDQIAAALHLKAIEMERGKEHTPQQH